MTRPTLPGATRPLVSGADLPGEGGTLFGGAVGSGLVPTSSGSNTWAWASNVARVSANGSNHLLGPFVNLNGGTGVSISVSSNTATISASGGDPSLDEYVWMPLTSVSSNTFNPELVWDDDDSLIPTLVPLESP